MQNYIDSFVLPIKKVHLEEYKAVAKQVAEIWKEYGALGYYEYFGDDLHLEGTRSFTDMADAKKDEVVLFGWVVFPTKEVRDSANKKVPQDPRMEKIVAPLLHPEQPIFDASRMVYGGFKPLVQSPAETSV